jgi:hypothetical protein
MGLHRAMVKITIPMAATMTVLLKTGYLMGMVDSSTIKEITTRGILSMVEQMDMGCMKMNNHHIEDSSKITTSMEKVKRRVKDTSTRVDLSMMRRQRGCSTIMIVCMKGSFWEGCFMGGVNLPLKMASIWGSLKLGIRMVMESFTGKMGPFIGVTIKMEEEREKVSTLMLKIKAFLKGYGKKGCLMDMGSIQIRTGTLLSVSGIMDIFQHWLSEFLFLSNNINIFIIVFNIDFLR